MRLDQALVARGLFESRARAQVAIQDGLVAVNDRVLKKSSLKITDEDQLALIGTPLKWVSRAALKLDHGLDQFGVDPSGMRALDIGASSGGFSEVLLARGAAFVTAIDVGHGQLAKRLHGHPKLRYIEGLNAKDIAAANVETPDLIVSDVSFISLTKALPEALSLGRSGANLIALVKPQFELEPARIGKNGVVTSADDHRVAVAAVEAFLMAQNWVIRGVTDSPIKGADGNSEFLLYALKSE